MKKKDNTKKASKDLLTSALSSQKQTKKSIINVMQLFAESTEEIDINSVEDVKKFLEELKSSLELCNKNIDTLESLIKKLDIDFVLKEDNISSSSQKENTDDINASEKDKNNYLENTLIISDLSGKVILPFQISNIEQELKDSNDEFSSIDEIINKKYTLPIEMFKNPFVSRFRESYKLMRKREKSSVKDAFDLGLELMFNYNLHPAIISACKNLDELDIYLDYLDSGETNQFKCFNIKFEIAPTVVK